MPLGDLCDLVGCSAKQLAGWPSGRELGSAEHSYASRRRVGARFHNAASPHFLGIKNDHRAD